jgi:hypothetical protein
MSVENRAQNALTACHVADAACMGTHWIYKDEDLASTLGANLETPEFHEPPSCPYYNSTDNVGHYNGGDMSPYGEEAHALLTYMSTETNDSEYMNGDNYARALFQWAQSYTGRKNHCTRTFEENMKVLTSTTQEAKVFPDCGVDPKPDPHAEQANSIWRVPAVVCRYCRDPALCLTNVETVVLVDQGSDVSVAFAVAFARMLMAVLDGQSVVQAVEAGKIKAPQYVVDAIEFAVLHSTSDGHTEDAATTLSKDGFLNALAETFALTDTKPEFRAMLGKTCSYPFSFIVSLRITLEASAQRGSSTEVCNAFVHATRANILFGGDSCGRVPLFAALLAASGEKVPDEWMKRTNNCDEVHNLGKNLVVFAMKTYLNSK